MEHTACIITTSYDDVMLKSADFYKIPPSYGYGIRLQLEYYEQVSQRSLKYEHQTLEVY